MTDIPTPYNAHFLIPASNPELQEKIKNIKNKNEFFLKLTQDYFDGKLGNSKSRREQLKDEKTEQEVLKLKINNQLQLLRELHKTPDEIVQIINNPESFKVENIPQSSSCSMSANQWDYVFGCIIDGWKIEGRKRLCLICQNEFGFDDSNARKHVMQCDDIKHKTAIQNALRGFVN